MSSTSARDDAATPPAALPEPAAGFVAYLAVQKGYSPATTAAYAKDLLQFEAFLATRGCSLTAPEAVTREHVRGFLAELHRRRTAKISMGRKLSSLRSFFRYLRQKKRVTGDPMAGIANPKPEKRNPQGAERRSGHRSGHAASGDACGQCLPRGLPGLGPGRTALRLGTAGERGRGPQPRRHRPVPGHRPRLRQGGKGTDRPLKRRLPGATRRLLAPPGRILPRTGRTGPLPRQPGRPPQPATGGADHRGTGQGSRAPPARPPPTCCATASPRICSNPAPTCVASRNSSATRGSPPPNATPTSTSRASCRSTTKPTRALPRRRNKRRASGGRGHDAPGPLAPKTGGRGGMIPPKRVQGSALGKRRRASGGRGHDAPGPLAPGTGGRRGMIPPSGSRAAPWEKRRRGLRRPGA